MEDHNITYFRNLWQNTVSDLENLCLTWEKICAGDQIPDDVHGEIRTTIGLARLLMNQKLKQFLGLIDDSEFNTGEKEITCSDLQGFWDMVFFEVEKIQKGFHRLDKCKNNEWKFVEENATKLLKKKVVSKDVAVTNRRNDSSKSHALAARQRLAAIKQKMLAQQKQQKDNLSEILPCDNINQFAKGSKNVTTQAKGIVLVEQNEVADECSTMHDVPKHNLSVPTQDKENVLPIDDTPNPKNIPAAQKKSKTKMETPVNSKTRRRQKEVIKLQCVTRSAKKALLAQENTM